MLLGETALETKSNGWLINMIDLILDIHGCLGFPQMKHLRIKSQPVLLLLVILASKVTHGGI